MKIPFLWTDEKMQELTSFIGTKTLGKMAEHFGTTVNVIRYQLRKRGVYKTGWTHARPQKEVNSISLFASRYGIRAASTHFGLPRGTIKNIKFRRKTQRMKGVKGLSPLEVQERRKNAVKFAWKRGLGDYAEDFGSFVVVQMVSSGTVNYEFAFMNFKRELLGDVNTKPGKIQRSINQTSVDINDPAVIQIKDNELKCNNIHQMYTELIEEMKLPDQLRPLFLMVYMWEFDSYDIAFLFDASIDEVKDQKMRLTQFLNGHREKLME